MTNAPYAYRLYGLTIASHLRLPELPALPGEGTRGHVELAVAELPAGLPFAAGLHRVGTGSLLNIPDAGRYLVEGGCRLLVEPLSGVPERNVRLYLLGSAFGLLLHQRGLLPLHANSVSVAGKGVAFLGPSGAGKSTLAAHLLERGCELLADDVSVVQHSASGWLVQPGLPRLRLWGETLRALGRDPLRHERAYAGDDSWDKYEIGVPAAAAEREAAPLQAIYLLDRGENGGIEPLSALDAVDSLFANTYRGKYVASAGNPQRHMEQCLSLARTVSMFRWTRAWNLDRMRPEINRLLEHLSTIARQELAPVSSQVS